MKDLFVIGAVGGDEVTAIVGPAGFDEVAGVVSEEMAFVFLEVEESDLKSTRDCGGEGEDIFVDGVDGGFGAVAADVGGDAGDLIVGEINFVNLGATEFVGGEEEGVAVLIKARGSFECFVVSEAVGAAAFFVCKVEFWGAAAGEDHGSLITFGAEGGAGVNAVEGSDGFSLAEREVEHEDIGEACLEISGVENFGTIGGPAGGDGVGGVVGELLYVLEEEVAHEDFFIIGLGVFLSDEGDLAGEEAGVAGGFFNSDIGEDEESVLPGLGLGGELEELFSGEAGGDGELDGVGGGFFVGEEEESLVLGDDVVGAVSFEGAGGEGLECGVGGGYFDGERGEFFFTGDFAEIEDFGVESG